MNNSYVQELIKDSFEQESKKKGSKERAIYLQTKVRVEVYRGNLAGHLTDEESKIAKWHGILPSRFTLHYIIPPSCKNFRFECNNITIVDSRLSDWLNRFVYNPVLNNMEEGDKVHLALPKWKPVMTMEDLDPKLKEFYEKRAKHLIDMEYFHIIRANEQRMR